MKKLNVIAIVSALTLMLLSVSAFSDTAIHAGAISYHVLTGHKNDYNSNHKLFAVEHNEIFVGRFSNSYHRTTTVAAYGFERQWDNWRGAVYVGALRGYRSCFGDNGHKAVICPVVFPTLHYTKYRVQPGILILGEAVALSLRMSL
jgi:hypothetical protein